MRVRQWQDLVADVVDRDVDPDDWRAVAGSRAGGIGEDLFLGHPKAGLYQLKTYPKNPFEVRGVGAQVARKLDDEIGNHLPDRGDGRFAVRRGATDEADAKRKARRVEETIKTHAQAPTTPVDLFDDVMAALDSPAYGPVEYDQRGRPDGLDALSGTFEEAEEILEMEFEDILAEDEIGRGFG